MWRLRFRKVVWFVCSYRVFGFFEWWVCVLISTFYLGIWLICRFWFSKLGVGLRFCVFKIFLGDVYVVGFFIILWVVRLKFCIVILALGGGGVGFFYFFVLVSINFIFGDLFSFGYSRKLGEGGKRFWGYIYRW